MNPIEQLDKFLLSEPRQVCDKIRPSGFGSCFRKQYWSRAGEPDTNPVDVEALRIFKLGNLIHEMIQDQLPQEMVELEFEGEDIKGHADFVDEDRVYDFKSCRGFAFNKYVKKGFTAEDLAREKLGYVLQVITYAIEFDRPIGTLLFIEKEGLRTVEFDFYVAEWREQVEEELFILRNYWEQKRLPPAMPRTNWCCENKKSGKKYCRFYDRCKEEEALRG